MRHLVNIHWGFGFGGIAAYTAQLSGLEARGAMKVSHVCIVGRNWNTDCLTLSSLGAIVINIRHRCDFSWLWRLPTTIRALGADLLMTHGFNAHLLWLLLRLMGFSQPLACSYHGQYFPRTRSRRIVAPAMNAVATFVLRKAWRVIVVSEYSRHELICLGVNPNRISVIHNGIPNVSRSETLRSDLRRAMAVREESTVIGAICRLEPIKGVSHLVEAVMSLPSTLDVTLVIVGDGPQVDTLKALAMPLEGRESIVFAGAQSEASRYLEAFDIFVSPSYIENHSISILEAMRAEKSMVVTDVGGNRESIRPNLDGLVVPARSSSALREALIRLITGPGEATKMASSARRRYLCRFTDEVMLEKTADVLSGDCN